MLVLIAISWCHWKLSEWWWCNVQVFSVTVKDLEGTLNLRRSCWCRPGSGCCSGSGCRVSSSRGAGQRQQGVCRHPEGAACAPEGSCGDVNRSAREVSKRNVNVGINRSGGRTDTNRKWNACFKTRISIYVGSTHWTTGHWILLLHRPGLHILLKDIFEIKVNEIKENNSPQWS